SAHRLTAARPHLSFAHLHGPGAPGVLPSFPTRRSSDLGPAAMVPVPRTAGTVILAVDVSNSMGADDVAPTRLAGAQRAARAFVEAQPDSVDIGVVAFERGALTTARPDADHSLAPNAVHRP